MYWFWDPTYIIILPAIFLSIYAQTKIQSTYNNYQNIRALKGFTGYDAAHRLLMQNGLEHVQIQVANGRLTDHYDPKTKMLRLSNDIYQ